MTFSKSLSTDELYIQRCIQLAQNGLGSTYPNPLVGSVVVHQGRIVGEGWHQRAGQDHAEVRAIKQVTDQQILKESTLYVSLEPCSHYGKTPPCADLIVACGIPRVVIGTTDPFAKVCGRGIEKLRAAGCEVVVGVLEEQCQMLNKRFFTYHQQKRPYIFLKWAETADGYLAPSKKEEVAPVWISNSYARQLAHQLRSTEQSILVGATTVEADDPSLTTREWYGNSPLRIVLDPQGRTPKHAKVCNIEAPTWLCQSTETIDFEKNVPEQLCHRLYDCGIQSLIVEGGAYTLQSFIEAGLWDEAWVFTGEVSFGEGLKAPTLSHCRVVERTPLQNTFLTKYQRIKS